MKRYRYNDRRNGSPPRFRQALVLLCCLTASTYFACHAYYGQHGWLARKELLDRRALLEFERVSLDRVREHLEHDVALLSSEPPHPDIVDEIARDVLGFVAPDDRIVAGLR